MDHRTPLGDATHRVSNGPVHAFRSKQEEPKEKVQWNRMHPTLVCQAENRGKNQAVLSGQNQAVQNGQTVHHNGQIQTPQTPQNPPPKTHIGPWQLGKTLGKGSSARVRAARHRVTHQFAAVKIVAKNTAHLTQAGSLARLDQIDSSEPSPDGVRRMPLAIEREVAILKLIEHPNIVKLYDIWENRSEIYLVLEYVAKGDLFEFINWQGRLREEEALYYFRQMMSAIQYCHSLNICHRDLKPENILLSADGQVKIADFGMAALHQSPTHHLRTACGSPHYAAPELLKQRMYKGETADIWSMGVILFAMLAGRLPFDEPDLHDMLAKAKRGDYTLPAFLSREAKDLLHRALQVEPRRRISMAQMWRHPLVRRYDYLDDLNVDGGHPRDIRSEARLGALREADLDPQILRQLRSVWHAFSEADLKAKLCSDKPNDEKLFYRLLVDYRAAQLENYQGLAHSGSDFHHLRPLAKRIATCQFAQPRKGHPRNVSRFTVISNVADTDDTVQSYDPYNAERGLADAQASHARIVVHRPDDVVSRSFRSYGRTASGRSKNASLRATRQVSRGARTVNTPPGSTNSLRGMPRVRTSSRHKRGVDFSSVRKRPARRGSTRDHTFPASSPKKRHSRTASADASEAREDSMIWNDELKQLGYTIAEHCDEAFRSSLLEEEPEACETADRRESSPLSFSLETPTSGQFAARPWDSRPLPPIPAEAEADRRIVSAPVYSQHNKPLPSVHEGGRTVSAPARNHTPGLPSPHDNRGIEYLARAENTIRLVESPSQANEKYPGPDPVRPDPYPVQAPPPLNLRKKDPPPSGRSSRLDMHDDQPAKKPWFKRSSRESGLSSRGLSSRGLSRLSSGQSTGTAASRKGFSFSWWKKDKEPKMSLAPSHASLDRDSGSWGRAPRSPDSETGRKIEVHQNWLARLFRVKPATRHLCLAVPRRRARQEIALLLREWRKYGVRDVEVDRERDVVFARLDPKNYLNIKGVSLAAEAMTVIEHGRRTPLCIVRFTQERGAASSFHKVVDTIRTVLDGRGHLVDKRKAKMMVKTLNS